jgi:molybdopterin-containing oxidoreductase family membrane subunit
LAAFAAPLVLSVHTIVSFDFAVSQVPGWHTTIFPPYFVAGAIFSGFAMVLTLLIPARELYPGMKDFVTAKTIENMCKIITLTGSMVGFAYIMEFFIAWYGGNPFEAGAFMSRAFGQYWWAYFIMMFCNVVSPQLFWIKWCRTNVWFIFAISIVVNIGMWFERFVITASLTYDFLPSSWAYYSPTIIDIGTYVGSMGIFMTLFLLFARFLPMLPISEVKNVLPMAHAHLHPHHDDDHGHKEAH